MKKTARLEYLFVLLVGIVAVLYLYGSIFVGVGWLSDDYDLIARNSRGGFWAAQEVHHYSPFVNFLFWGASLGVVTPFFFHFLALLFHLLNTLFVFWIGRKGLEFSFFEAALGAFLFAVAPAGSESLIWCCALPYVLLATGLLLTIGLYLLYLKGEFSTTVTWLSLFFGAMQIILFFVWDWAILLFPLMTALAFFAPSLRNWGERAFPLNIACAGWVMAIVLKKVFGLTLGYHFNLPAEMVKNLISSPFVGAAPQFSKEFYQSSLGITAMVVFAIVLCAAAFKDRRAALVLVLFIMCQMPQVLMGYPQARYHYVSMFALVYLLIFTARLIPATNRAFGRAALASLAVLYIGWTGERVDMWIGAFSSSAALKEQIVTAGVSAGKPMVIVNLPQWYGEGMIWRPFIWRCGYDSIEVPFVRVDTPDSGQPTDSSIQVLDRDVVGYAYPKHAVYEVVKSEQSPHIYRLVALN